MIAILLILYYEISAVYRILHSPKIEVDMDQAFMQVTNTHPMLNNTENAETFPAVTVTFYIPENTTLDPYEYFDTLYFWPFKSPHHYLKR